MAFHAFRALFFMALHTQVYRCGSYMKTLARITAVAMVNSIIIE